MHDIVLAHIVQRYQNLNCKPFYQRQTKTHKVVHLDEIVEVDRKEFESENQMFAEVELVAELHNILLVLGVLFIQSFDKFGLHQTLFVQTSFVFQNFQSNELLLLVIKNSQHDTKGSFSKFFDDFVSKGDMFVVAHYIFLRVRVKAIICGFVGPSVCRATWQLRISLVLHSLVNVEKVNCGVFVDFGSLTVPQVRAQIADGISLTHGEFKLRIACVLIGRSVRGSLRFLRTGSHFGTQLGWTRGWECFTDNVLVVSKRSGRL